MIGQQVGGLAFGAGDKVPVHVEGYVGVRVAENAGDGDDVNAQPNEQHAPKTGF